MSVCLLEHMFVFFCQSLSFCLPVSLSDCLCVWLSAGISATLYLCLLIFLSARLHVYLSVRLSSLSVCLSVWLLFYLPACWWVDLAHVEYLLLKSCKRTGFVFNAALTYSQSEAKSWTRYMCIQTIIIPSTVLVSAKKPQKTATLQAKQCLTTSRNCCP